MEVFGYAGNNFIRACFHAFLAGCDSKDNDDDGDNQGLENTVLVVKGFKDSSLTSFIPCKG
jgi:hypothetical protein